MKFPHEHRPRVAVIGTNDPRNFSGGRYHGLMLAYAVAAAGGEAHVITDHVPGFVADLEPLCPGGVTIHQTSDFTTGLPEGGFDWVIVVPTGIFLPDFYEACLDFAGQARARLALVNFESGNWFNAEAPAPRDPRLWDYWRRLCLGGALILSSARTSQDWAKAFYSAPEGNLRFEVWSPPVNSAAARRFDGLAKDGSILAFIRPQDAHKGSSLLSQIDPEFFTGRTLRLVSGRDVPPPFADAMRAHLAKARNARLEILLRISDVQKFRIMTMAQAVLATTRFEGFGYPPVEAAYAGTESVCFGLPVLRDTVGKIAHFAPSQNIAGLQTALAAALGQPERRETLRRHVHGFADFDEAAWHLADILLRSTDRVAPMAPRPFRVAVGPLARTAPTLPAQLDRKAAVPPFPPYVVSAVAATGGDVLITGRAALPPQTLQLRADLAGKALPIAWESSPQSEDGFCDTRFFLVAPKHVPQRRVTVTACDEAGTPGSVIELQIDRVMPAPKTHPARAGISESKPIDGQPFLRGWVLAREPVAAVLLRSGTAWQRLAVTTDRRDVLQQYPGYATARCEFSGQAATPAAQQQRQALWLCLAGSPDKEYAVDLLTGWPPSATRYFAEDPAAKPAAPKPAAPGPVALKSSAISGPRARRPCLGKLEIVNQNDSEWTRGVARGGAPDRLGAILVRNAGVFAQVLPGSLLRFNSATMRRVVAVEAKGEAAVIVLDAPLIAAAGSADLMDPGWAPDGAKKFVLNGPPDGQIDAQWWKSICNEPGAKFRRGFVLPADRAAQLGLAVDVTLRFAASGPRRITACENDADGQRRIWLDGVIRPMGDGAPHEVIVERPVAGGERPFSLARAGAGWPGGVLARNTGQIWAGQGILLEPAPANLIRRGALLRFAGNLVLPVTGVTTMHDGLEITLDGVLDPQLHGHPHAVCLADAADQPDGQTHHIFSHNGLTGKDPLFLKLSSHARRHGEALRPAAPRPAAERRILFVSLVSPCPANQGNRVVTRNLIRHFVELGYGCDVIVQNWVDGAAVAQEFGPQVRLLAVPVPQWEDAPAARRRRAVSDAAAAMRNSPFDAGLADLFEETGQQFHPFFIVRDETVELARMLYAGHEYEALICNYTHMARIAVELQAIRPLPPTAVITHDALSRLPRAFAGKKLDLAYRACPPALERDVLNTVPDAVVVAISSSEAAYFRDIGVRNPIVLTEYDAAEEMAAWRVPETACARRRIIFNGSANPMNLAGLDWFADECWAAILAQVPDARLIICGRASTAWQANLPGVELAGELSREDMARLCAGASITINPCVAGTGLKIKTVEAACLGLPAVCLPAAIDGLEDVAGAFAIVARDGPGFAAGCISLLTDAALWQRLRAGALDIAGQRFSAGIVYAALDAALGLSHTTGDFAPVAPAAPIGLCTVPDPVARLEEDPQDEAALMSLGRRLIRAGQAASGWDMVERVAGGRPGDAGVALQTAAAALEAGEFWRAVIFAAAFIAARPELAEGYRLMGRGLLGCKLAHDAVATLEQGALAAPWHAGVRAALHDALIAAGRPKDALAWRDGRTNEPGYHAYVPLDEELCATGAYDLSAGEVRIFIVLPENPAAHSVLALDLRKPDLLTQDIEVHAAAGGCVSRAKILAKGPPVQTMQIPLNLSVLEANGVILLRIKPVAPPPSGGPLSIIGYILQESEMERRPEAEFI